MSLHASETSHENDSVINPGVQMMNIGVHNIIFKMPPSSKSHWLLIISPFSEKKDIEKMKNLKSHKLSLFALKKELTLKAIFT